MITYKSDVGRFISHLGIFFILGLLQSLTDNIRIPIILLYISTQYKIIEFHKLFVHVVQESALKC